MVITGTTKFFPGHTAQVNIITRFFQVRGTGFSDIGYCGKSRNEQRRGNGRYRAILLAEVVIETVFARNEGGTLGQGKVTTA
ncbi:MAG TPA: hypothetical protein PK644_10515, partial [bacterium]|nr:hypothetical protein [bacterium]